MYKLVAVIMDGVIIKGYRMISDNGDVKNIQASALDDLVRTGKLQGVSLVEYDGKEYFTGLNLKDLMIESTSTLKVVRPIEDGNSIVGYVCTDSKGVEKNISAKKAWNLAATDCIENAKASFSRDADGKIKKYFQII